LQQATSGKLAFFSIQSKNEVGQPIDNVDDQFDIKFEGPDNTPFGNFYVTAAYSENGIYNAQYVP
jgi:hypothetical protein